MVATAPCTRQRRSGYLEHQRRTSATTSAVDGHLERCQVGGVWTPVVTEMFTPMFTGFLTPSTWRGSRAQPPGCLQTGAAEAVRSSTTGRTELNPMRVRYQHVLDR